MKLDKNDFRILTMLQRNCRMPTREIAQKLGLPVTTVFAKIKRMEQKKIIKEYRAILDSTKLQRGTIAFILVSFSYRTGDVAVLQREIAAEIAKFPEVQEVHIISGDWDILIKTRDKTVHTIGNFVIDKLRTVKGIDKTLTCMVFATQKETTEIFLP